MVARNRWLDIDEIEKKSWQIIRDTLDEYLAKPIPFTNAAELQGFISKRLSATVVGFPTYRVSFDVELIADLCTSADVPVPFYILKGYKNIKVEVH